MSTRSQTLASHGDVLDNIPGLLGFPPKTRWYSRSLSDMGMPAAGSSARLLGSISTGLSNNSPTKARRLRHRLQRLVSTPSQRMS